MPTTSSSLPQRAVAAFLTVLAVCASSATLVPGRASAADARVDRGRYLVQRVGMCADCHGPGLRGATLDFLAPGLPPAVARKSPRIAGLPELSNAQAVHFFETGLLPNGKQARPPMPAYRLHRDDAEAVTAFLKTMH